MHECLLADVASVQGMLYFFFLALGVMFVTGFCRYAGIRSKCLHVLAANIAVELMLGSWVAIVGVRTVRVAVLAVLIVLLANTSARSDKIELVHEQLNSAKMKRMLRSALRESLCGGKN